MNLVRGTVDDDGIALGGQRLPFPRRTTLPRRRRGRHPPRGAGARQRPRATPCSNCPVVLSEMLGSDVLLHLEAPTSSVLTGDMLDTGDDLVEDTSRFIARVPPNLRPAPGERVRLRVDMSRVHLFDPATEAVIRR